MTDEEIHKLAIQIRPKTIEINLTGKEFGLVFATVVVGQITAYGILLGIDTIRTNRKRKKLDRQWEEARKSRTNN